MDQELRNALEEIKLALADNARRLERVEKRLEDSKFERIDTRFEQRFESIAARVERIENSLNSNYKAIKNLESWTKGVTIGFGLITSSAMFFIIQYLMKITGITMN